MNMGIKVNKKYILFIRINKTTKRHGQMIIMYHEQSSMINSTPDK